MNVLALIATAKCADLTALCVDSLKRYAPEVDRLILVNQMDKSLRTWLADSQSVWMVNDDAQGVAEDHASAIANARQIIATWPTVYDVIVLVDNDCVVLDYAWLVALSEAFAWPMVGAWGAQAITGDVLHASMLAMRGELFHKVSTFHAKNIVQNQEAWRDTAGVACDEIRGMGWSLMGVKREMAGPGWAAYWAQTGQPMWRHLGSGTSSTPITGLPRAWRSVKARCGGRLAQKAILREARRAEFLAAGRRWLAPNPYAVMHGRLHDPKMVEDHR